MREGGEDRSARVDTRDDLEHRLRCESEPLGYHRHIVGELLREIGKSLRLLPAQGLRQTDLHLMVQQALLLGPVHAKGAGRVPTQHPKWLGGRVCA